MTDQAELEFCATEEHTADRERAKNILQKMLQDGDGIVSFKALNRHLTTNGLDPDLFRQLKAYDFGEQPPHWIQKGRSFYTSKRFEEAEAQSIIELDDNADEPQPEIVGESGSAEIKRSNHREEKRFCRYIVEELENIYYSSHSPDEMPYVFDVADNRPRKCLYSNVDLIAVSWNRYDQVELITVEAKLAFTPLLVQQAINYTRFSHRVWIAVPVSASVENAATEIRDTDPLLFDYVVHSGIGILAGKKARGNSYHVFPIHWPRVQNPSRLEIEAFKEAYKDQFVEAGVVQLIRRPVHC